MPLATVCRRTSALAPVCFDTGFSQKVGSPAASEARMSSGCAAVAAAITTPWMPDERRSSTVPARSTDPQTLDDHVDKRRVLVVDDKRGHKPQAVERGGVKRADTTKANQTETHSSMILYQASRPRHRSSARSRARAPETAAGTATRFLALRTPCLDNDTCVALPPSATRAVDLQKRALGGEWTRPDPGEGG